MRERRVDYVNNRWAAFACFADEFREAIVQSMGILGDQAANFFYYYAMEYYGGA
jgi:hypothetical protein